MSNPNKNLPKAKAAKDKESTSKKATIAEQTQRVSEVQTLLLQGYTRSYILQYSAKWGLQDRQIDNYIAEATINIKEVSRAGLESDLAILISAMWDTFRRAVVANNVGEQRQTLMAIAKLKGLDETRINHVIDDKRQLAGLSDQELDSILEQDATAKH